MDDIIPYGMDIGTAIFLIIMFVILIALFWAELTAHDCIGDKHCTHRKEEPLPEDPINIQIDTLSEMIQGNIDFIIWRRALIVAILVGFFVGYFFRGRVPSPMEWIIVGVIIFIGAYFAASWLCSHFLQPNTKRIRDNLNRLKEKL